MGHYEMHTEKKEAIVVFDVEGVDGRERGEKEQVTAFHYFSLIFTEF
jgi:predicted RNA-binding protein with PIN domain